MVIPDRVRSAGRPLLRLISRPGMTERIVNQARGRYAGLEVRRQGPERFLRRSWYYSVELTPGVVAQGQYHPDLPMLPRMMMRQLDLAGMDCLDLGSVEGLMPVLMRRAGAKHVLATDYTNYNAAKIAVVKALYGVDFDFRSVGLMYDLDRKIRGGFDFINCSGLLYHTWSPIHVLAGVRPLLRRRGLMIVSTNVVDEDGFGAEFNAHGRLNQDMNTFWYTSMPLLEYILRSMRLTPVHALYLPEDAIQQPMRRHIDKKTGYLSVLCRAEDALSHADAWTAAAVARSWEYRDGLDWTKAKRQDRSSIATRLPDETPVDLLVAARENEVRKADTPDDSHLLRLSATA